MPLKALLVYGLEWFLIIIPTLIILAILVGGIHYDTTAQKIFYAQKLFALAGIALLAQVFWGHRLPIVIGPAAVLLIGILTANHQGIDAIYTAIILGGALLTILSYTNLLYKFTKLFTHRIITVILALIALTLTPTIIQLVFGNQINPLHLFILSIALFTAMVILNKVFRGIWKSTTVLWGLLVGSIVYRICFPGQPSMQMVSYSQIPWQEMFIPGFKLNIGVLFAFFFCYIALFINEIGSIQAVEQALEADNPDKRTKDGLRMTGLSNILCGLFGTIGFVDFSISPGIIMNTGCASRYTLIPAALGLIVCAIFPNLIVMICDIPLPVMGIVLLFIMVSQLASSFKMMTLPNVVRDFTDCTTIALPLMLALFISFLPQNVINEIPEVLRPIVSNGFVVGVVGVLAMEHLINRK